MRCGHIGRTNRPDVAAPTLSLIGPGRAGRSVRDALIDLGWQCEQVFGRGDDVGDAARGVDLCVIATPDAVISDVASRIQPGNAVLMHLSGATPLVALGREHETAALHPLQTLPNAEVGRRALRTAYFAVAGHPIARDIAEQLSGKCFEIADDDRALYHCTAAIAANHVTALLGQVERLAAAIDVPVDAFWPLAAASLDNVMELGASAALTGPVARGDEQTVARHENALAERLPDELDMYRAMVAAARRLVDSGSTPD